MKNHLFFTVLAIFFIAVFAQVTLHLPTNEGSIPITGQTFAVLLVGYILHRKWGAIAVIGYIFLGTLGLPIFADGKSGWMVLTGGSGGFFLGFLVAVWLVGWFGEKAWSKNFFKSLIAMTLGTLVILFFGVSWLAYLYDLEKALDWGFYPFLWGAVIKIIVGASILPSYFYWKNKLQS